MVPVRRWIARNVLGLKVDGLLASTKCGNPLCVEPSHIEMKTRAKLQKDTSDRLQYQQNPVRNYKLALAARARSPHSPELIEKIRNMEGTHKGIARELGISFDVVNRVKNGTGYKTYTNNPWAGL
jgi:DNA invertase Pin-like site-specific DNA recombinase